MLCALAWKPLLPVTMTWHYWTETSTKKKHGGWPRKAVCLYIWSSCENWTTSISRVWSDFMTQHIPHFTITLRVYAGSSEVCANRKPFFASGFCWQYDTASSYFCQLFQAHPSYWTDFLERLSIFQSSVQSVWIIQGYRIRQPNYVGVFEKSEMAATVPWEQRPEYLAATDTTIQPGDPGRYGKCYMLLGFYAQLRTCRGSTSISRRRSARCHFLPPWATYLEYRQHSGYFLSAKALSWMAPLQEFSPSRNQNRSSW